MDTSQVASSRQTSLTIWLALVLLAALAWAVLIQQSRTIGNVNDTSPVTNSMDSTSSMTAMSQSAPTAGSEPVPIFLYLPLWIAMMVAMMFPAAAPVVSLFVTISQNRRVEGQSTAPTWIFLVGYLAIWSLLGVGAYLLSLALPALGMMAAGLNVSSPMIAGAVLIFAGLYQLTPLKQSCLQHCRSPLSVILHGWHDGKVGASRMGFEHGAHCVGCCWGLMLVLFVVGLMNLVGMVVLSAVIFIEKVIPRGPLIGKLTALVLILVGVWTVVGPILGGMRG